MARKISIKKYAGVYFTESKVRRWRERPDKVYWVKFKDSSGKIRWERCGWASEGWTPEAAQRRRFELLEQDRTGSYKPRRKRRRERITFGEIAQKYINWARQSKKSWKDDELRYKRHLEPVLSKDPLKSVSPLKIERLKRDLYKKGLSDGTVKHCLVLVRQIFNKARAWGLYDGPNPIRQVKLPSPNNKRTRFLTLEEADDLLEELKRQSKQVYDQALLSLHCGLRFGEIASLKWGDLDFRNGIIHVRDPKAGESRQAFMTEQVSEMFLDRMPEDVHPGDLVFPGRGGVRQKSVSKAFFRAIDKLGFNKGVEDTREKVVFHTLRHTFASWLAIQGTPLFTIKELMGHKSLAMTERYAHLIPDHKRDAVKALAERFCQSKKDKQKKVMDLADERHLTSRRGS